MNQEETRIQNLENEVKLLKIEIAYLKRILGVEREKKDPKAWEKLESLRRFQIQLFTNEVEVMLQ